jgi:hypothetical protein
VCDACGDQHSVLVVAERVAVVCDDDDAHGNSPPFWASCLTPIYAATLKSDEKTPQRATDRAVVEQAGQPSRTPKIPFYLFISLFVSLFVVLY